MLVAPASANYQKRRTSYGNRQLPAL